MTRRLRLVAAFAATALALTMTGVPAEAHGRGWHGRPTTYELHGDPTDPAGSKYEGIGVNRNGRVFYVSETTGGEIHRGKVRSGHTEVWLDEGVDGRTTARGITVDRRSRVYIAGGPNSRTGGPDLWVYGRDKTLLAGLRVGVDNPFVNDVAIGPDGAAYFTNSNAPQIFRVARQRGTWQVSVWADATGVIETASGFNLGGIVVSPDRRALIVAQGNLGKLWRFDLRTRAVTPVDIGAAKLGNADGLVLRGRTLLVVRNFDRILTTLRVRRDGSAAELVRERATDPDRVFTTAKLARGRLLLVDSKFDEPVAAPPYEVVALRVGR
jgi:hypothetical protein